MTRQARAATPARSFLHVLINTFIANLTTSFLWFAVTFWVFLETRSVLATSLLGGSYMLLMAALGVPFGGLVDRWRKKRVMVVAQLVTAVSFMAAFAVFLLWPRPQLTTVGSPAFWLLAILVLVGAVVESARGIALSTTVTLLVPPEGRGSANGQVGLVNGLSFAVTSVFSGLAVGQLGMGWTFAIAVALTVLSLAHLTFVPLPEPEVVHADGTPKPVDFGGAWRAIVAVPGLIGLIAFSTLNNLLGGVFIALMDPYGLSLVSVELWGVIWGIVSLGFMIGGGAVAKVGVGSRPLRSLLWANLAMWTMGVLFTIRESIWLTAVGIFVWMALMPVAEAAEQTLLQRVVPYEKQGRVFGLAQAVEVAASPVSAFLVGPLAQFWLIPYLASPQGATTWRWLLGDGAGRGIAAVFVLAGLLGLVLTAAAFCSPAYRRLSETYATSGPSPGERDGEVARLA